MPINTIVTPGNDVEGSETPSAPVNTVTKTSTKTGKPNADGTAPAKSAPTDARSTPRGGFNANETGMETNLMASVHLETENEPWLTFLFA